MPHESCQECELGRRAFVRDFLRDLGAAVVVVLGYPSVARGQTRAYPIPAQDGATIDRESEVIVVRWQGSVYAFNLACPHQNTALRWLEKDARFQCPKHKSKYRPDGTFIEGRATRGMDRFAVRREGGGVLVDLDRLHKQSDDAAGWAAAVVRL
jgi:nitrite reductase/ring-hydroxylating ferredoxin subunit